MQALRLFDFFGGEIVDKIAEMDDLYEVRNNILLGNFHSAIADAQSAKTTAKTPQDKKAFEIEKEFLIAKAQVGLGQHEMVIGETNGARDPMMIAVHHWAEMKRALVASNDDGVKTAADALAKTAGDTPSPALAPIAALASAAHLHAGDISASLSIAGAWNKKLSTDDSCPVWRLTELKLIVIYGYLILNRVDLATKELAEMNKIDDDSTIYNLCNAMIKLRRGGEKPQEFQEAKALLEDIAGRCGQSVSLLNLSALAYHGLGDAAQAENYLMDALSKRGQDADTNANLAATAVQQGKSLESVKRFVDLAKGSAWNTAYTSKERQFDEAAAQLTPL